MLLLGNLVYAAGYVLDWVLDIYMWMIIINALLSWVNPDPYNPIVRFLHAVTEPVLRPLRRLIGHRLGPLDISPLLVVIAIVFVQKFLVSSLIELGIKIKGGSAV